MNPLDLFVLGVCEGAGKRDYHSGGHVFDDSFALELPLRQLGIHRWWTHHIGKGWLA